MVKGFLLKNAVNFLQLLHVAALLNVFEVQMVDGDAVVLLGNRLFHGVRHGLFASNFLSTQYDNARKFSSGQ